jgi:hypothetical protein
VLCTKTTNTLKEAMMRITETCQNNNEKRQKSNDEETKEVMQRGLSKGMGGRCTNE